MTEITETFEKPKKTEKIVELIFDEKSNESY